MFTVVTIVIVLALLVVGSLVLALIWVVKAHNRKKKVAGSGAPVTKGPVGPSESGICSSCGEERIIVKPELTMCASCYSSLGTKKLG